MNRILLFFLALLLTVSCKQEEKTGLDKLREQKATLKHQMDSLQKILDGVDEQIALLDSTKRYTLVTTLPVENKTFQHFFEVQGTIEADRNVTLYPEMGGVVQDIPVDEGQRVRKGDILMDFDTELIELQIKEVQTNLELATTTYERQKRLWEKNIGSEMQYLQAKNQKETLENTLSTLKAQLRKNQLRAPFDGVVDEIWPKLGELTSPQTPALRLVNLDQVHLKADVSEAYLGKIKVGTEVQVYFPAFDTTTMAKVAVIGNFINPNNRTFRIQVDLDNKENNIKPNLMAYLRIKDFEQADGLIVPDRLIQENPQGGKFVYLADKAAGLSHVHQVAVEVGMSYQNKTLILDGLMKEDILVDKGARSIKDGQKVRVVE